MTLSKQLFTIITFIFIIIFVGNFTITVNNIKEYLEQESTTKAKDTAVSLGMILKSLIANKKDPEIKSTIKVIADSGFYSSIVLEDLYYTFTDKELLDSNNIFKSLDWQVSNISIDKNIGEVLVSNEENLENELNELEDIPKDENTNEGSFISDKTYTFIPKGNFDENNLLIVSFTAQKNSETLNIQSNLKLSKILVSSKRKIKFDDVPQWFIDFIDIDIPVMNSQINDGWKTTAIVYVSPNPGIAYKKLYDQVLNAFLYSIFSFFIAIILLYIFLLFILRPLKNIENLALEISNGTFAQIKNIPWTKELKAVSLAMNNMSQKIETVISKLNNNIESITSKLSTDSLTKLPLRQEFETDIKKLFMEKSKGYIYLIKIHNLMDFAKENGARDVDKFIVSFANILKSFKNASAYRLFGSEFLIIFHNISDKENQLIMQQISTKLEELAKSINKQNIAHAGVIAFDQYDTISSILSNSSEAHEMAKQVGPNMCYLKSKDDRTMGAMKWRELVHSIINENKFTLDYKGEINENKSNNIQEAFANVKDEDNNLLPIGTFISVAQENNLAIKFDQLVLDNVITYINDSKINHKIIVNLSFESIQDVDFLDYIKDCLIKNSEISNQLVFTLTAYSISANKEYIKKFAKFIKENNSNFMIKRYETKFVSIDDMKYIKPTSIRLSREYTNKINNDDNKKALINAICNVSGIIDIEIYSENISDNDDFIFLNNLGINVYKE